jgi:ribosome biogenesis GTPase
MAEHKERYTVWTPDRIYDGELLGNLRFTARDRYDFPAVGDWVAITEYDEGKALIHAIYPRSSTIVRQAVGKTGQIQIIATNIDIGLIVQAVDRDFNLNRLERYLTICHSSNVTPLFILSKIDLVSMVEIESMVNQIHQRMPNVSIITVSNQTTNGYNNLKKIIEKGKTYCLLGSSGVGKSTLLNSIAGKQLMETNEISSSVNKGRHTTSHRELVILNNGGILIDNPGMREVGMTDATGGLELTFDIIMEYSGNCRFKDCTHMHENGCAVLEAVDNGEIDQGLYNNYLKLEKEKAHFETSAADRKRRDKVFGRLIKRVLKERGKNKF